MSRITYQVAPPIQDLYRAFMRGFSDYIIPFTMDEASFEARLLVRDQNQPSRSIVAYVDGEPAGVMLSGIAYSEGEWRTRCGGMAVAPECRGQGIARELMRQFDEQAQGTRVLEVIQGNRAAEQLYARLGYHATRSISYHASRPMETNAVFDSLPVTYAFDTLYPNRTYRPIWQCDLRVTQQQATLFRVTEGTRQGYLLLTDTQLLDGFAADLDVRWLLEAAAAKQPFQLALSSDRPLWEAAAESLGFEKQPIVQFEMERRP